MAVMSNADENPELMYAATEISKAKRECEELRNLVRLDPLRYVANCAFAERMKMANAFSIKKVIFNAPATIVYWNDGSKTVVKATNEPFDPEKGLAMAISKKVYGNSGSYYNQFKEHIRPYRKKLLNDIRKMSSQGKSEKEIANCFGLSSTVKLRELKSELIKEERDE